MSVKFVLNQLKQFFSQRYYSELGEDILLEQYCPDKNGFFVDIGAFHPKRISVTRKFYERGYRGINIEPNPDSIKAFNRMRKRDINLNIGLSDETGELNYYYYGKRATGNTFDAERHKYLNRKAEKIIKIKVDTLNNILDKYLPEGMIIDFLTIDVEGYEFKILQALNYEKYSPKHILVEDLTFWDKDKNFMDFINSELYNFLYSKGYVVAAKTWYTILFRKIE